MNKQYCERCEKNGKFKQELNQKELTPQECKEKVQIARFSYNWKFIYLGYNYFECPICRWFKFVKKEKYHKILGIIDVKKNDGKT